MSHFTKIKTKLYNLTILKESLNDLSLETEVGNKEIRGYNNQKHVAELVIKQSNNHDISSHLPFQSNNHRISPHLPFHAGC